MVRSLRACATRFWTARDRSMMNIRLPVQHAGAQRRGRSNQRNRVGFRHMSLWRRGRSRGLGIAGASSPHPASECSERSVQLTIMSGRAACRSTTICHEDRGLDAAGDCFKRSLTMARTEPHNPRRDQRRARATPCEWSRAVAPIRAIPRSWTFVVLLDCLCLGAGRHTSYTGRAAPFSNAWDNRMQDNHTQLWPDVVAETSAGTLGFSQPRQANCTLWFLRDVLYAYSYLPGNDVLLLRHWLSHYIDGLGLRPDHVSLATSADLAPTHLAATMETLEQAGIERSRVTLVNGSYSDHEKISRVNEYVRGLPRDAWMILADLDELFSFSCAMSSAVRRSDRFCAQMRDRLAADGTIAPLRPFPDISVQYPVACGLRQLLSQGSHVGGGQFMTSKTALYRVWLHGGIRLFRNPHNIGSSAANSCDFGHAALAHYTLTAQAMEHTESKVQHHEAEARSWRVRADELRARNSSIKREDALHATRQGAASFIACSLTTKLGEPCQDYKRLLAFMLAQKTNPSRQLNTLSSNLCTYPSTPAVGARTARWVARGEAGGQQEVHQRGAPLAGTASR